MHSKSSSALPTSTLPHCSGADEERFLRRVEAQWWGDKVGYGPAEAQCRQTCAWGGSSRPMISRGPETPRTRSRGCCTSMAVDKSMPRLGASTFPCRRQWRVVEDFAGSRYWDEGTGRDGERRGVGLLHKREAADRGGMALPGGQGATDPLSTSLTTVSTRVSGRPLGFSNQVLL